jgi:kynurenine formamidase
MPHHRPFRNLVSSVAALAMLLVGRDVASAQALDLSRYEIVDLSHSFDDRTVFWPTAPSTFELTELARGRTEGGYFYSAYRLCTPEHGGTHLDAPVHFSESGGTAGSIPLTRLVAHAVVLDVSEAAAGNRDYRLTGADVLAWERQHGRIESGTIVLLRTGWSRYWPDARAYLGDDKPGDASRLSFPSFGEDAARLLVEDRRVGALGVDTASMDYGRSSDFLVHRIAAARDVPGFENLTGLDRLPARGAVVVALPMKIASGSGAPLRAIALVPRP